MKYTTEQIMRLAIIIDNKSCFSIYTHKTRKREYPGHCAIISIEESRGNTLDWLVNNFGGHKGVAYLTRTTNKERTPKRYRYAIYGDKIREVCELIMPYLLNKQPHAQIMLRMRATYNLHPQHKGCRGSPRIDDKTIELRNQLMVELGNLNRPSAK
jgi:hypothetical protein